MDHSYLNTELILEVFNDMCCFVITDEKGRYVFANNAWSKTMGVDFEAEDYRGKPVTEFIKDTKIEISLKEDRQISGYSTITMRDGSSKRAFSMYNPIHDDNGKIIAGAIISIMTGDDDEVQKLLKEINLYKQEIKKINSTKYNIDSIKGVTPAIVQLKNDIIQAAKSNSTVLIYGETGSGKELVANAIHSLSARNNENFVVVNCANIPNNLLESEFFGYEKGAFTGANTTGKLGKFDQANKGTLFLDEINQLSMTHQPKLLRVMQEREFERVGGNKSIDIDIRFIAATNIPLNQLVKDKKFRPDLFYRLNVIPINVPPLRERKEDIPILIDDILDRLDSTIGIPVKDIHMDVKYKLMNLDYDWPGNVRELYNLVEWAVNMSGDEEITWEHLARYFDSKPAQKAEKSLKLENLQNTERDMVVRALKESRNRTEAAKLLGISRTMLYKKIKKYNL